MSVLSRNSKLFRIKKSSNINHFFHICRPYARQWAKREAYLEIERRKKAGLPLISKDLLDPAVVAIQLPPEEELGDFQILI